MSAGLTWFEGTPATWPIVRTKFLFARQQRPVREGDDIVTAFRDGQVALRRNRRTEGFTNAAKEIGYQGIRKGDLVVHAMDAFAGAIGVAEDDGKSTPVYSVCTPKRPDVFTPYYARLLRHMALSGFVESLSKGVRERSTEFRWAELSEVSLPMPPAAEQERIANFLDEQTARIDALIAEKERLLLVLSESLDSAIERTVLAPDGTTSKVALKRVAHRVITGPFGSALHSSEYVEGGVPVINPSHILSATLVPAADVSVNQATASALASYKLSEGELVVGRRGEMGRCAVVPPEGSGWLCGTGCLLVTPNPAKVNPEYLQLVVSSRAAREWLSLESVGSTMENLNTEILGRLPGYFPSREEQGRRVAEAVIARNAHAKLFSHVETHISRLREYRSSLISAAVTGQLDINAYKEAA